MVDNPLLKRTDESEFDYHKRIIYGKLKDKTLSDYDYDELARFAYGKDYARDETRKRFYGSLYTLDLLEQESINNIESNEILSNLDEKIIELQREKQKFFDYRSAFNKVVRERSRQEELNEIIADSISNGSLPQLDYTYNSIEPSDNDLLVSLNDLHYGVEFENYWGKYNPDICKQMLSHYLDEIIRVANMHNSENCIVWENGDAINGNIRLTVQVANKENVIKQVTGVSELISEFLAELSNHFKTVKFVSVSGNHSRIAQSKEDSLPEERLDDLIGWYLKARLQNFDNILIDDSVRIDPTMYLINIRGLNYLGCHGDYEMGNKKVQALQTMARKPIYAILSGHLHHNKIDSIQGIKTIMAGSFMGVDSYCAQKRIFGRPEQMICVVDSDGVRCSYDIAL